MTDEHDIDRAAILARRQRFISMALAGLASGSLLPAAASAEPPAPQPTEEPAPEPPPETMSEAERYERAKQLYDAGVAARARGDLHQALVDLEAAYYLVPGKHGIALVIGETAYSVRNCALAKEYLLHFLTYADPSERLDRVELAKMLLEEIAISGCADPPSEPYMWEWSQPEVCLSINRPGTLTACERRRERREQLREQRREDRRARRRDP